MANKKIELDEATFDKINYTYDALHKKYGDDLGGVSFPPPINLLTPEEIQKMSFRITWSKEMKEDVGLIKNSMVEFKTMVESLQKGDIVIIKNEVSNITTKLDSFTSIEPEEGSEPTPVPESKEPEVKEKVSIGKKLSQWIDSKVAVYINMSLLLASTAFMIIAGLYALRWSDDAWARRAYDVGVRIGMERPGDFYHETRERFNTEQRRTAKAAVLDMEEHDGKIDGKHEDDIQVAGKENNTDTNLKKESTPWIESILKKLQELDNKWYKF